MHDGKRGPRWQSSLAAYWLQAWTELFAQHLGPTVPPIVQYPPCSEFAATGAAITHWPRAFWAAALDWVLASDMAGEWQAWVWESMWAWLLSGQAKYYQEQADCFCSLYGACTPNGGAAQQ